MVRPRKPVAGSNTGMQCCTENSHPEKLGLGTLPVSNPGGNPGFVNQKLSVASYAFVPLLPDRWRHVKGTMAFPVVCRKGL